MVDGDGLRVIEQLDETHVATLHRLYQGEWWTRGRSLEDTQRCVEGSQLCIGLVDETRDLVGFVRVITDYTFKALVFDVIVTPSQRGRGLGDRLLELVRSHERLAGVRHFELYCLPELLDFYRGHGYSSEVGGVQLMRRDAG